MIKNDTSNRSNPDIIENTIRQHPGLLEILLIDRTKTTKQKVHNILWATSSYDRYKTTNEIQLADVTGKNTFLIQPRISKTKEEQKSRTHDKAEVFTPRGTVYQMNQRVDWSLGHWPVTEENWRDFVLEKRLEITCGEAPFIVGRYNAVNGKKVLKLSERVGFLDKKLQVVSQFCSDETSWYDWAIKAFQCSYGYEWQGDNLLIARENLLYTFIDYYNNKFQNKLINMECELSLQEERLLSKVATIISWNLFQMDGVRCVVPMSCKHAEEVVSETPGLLKMLGEKDVIKKKVCEGCLKSNPKLHNGKKVKVMDWETGKPVLFCSLLRKA